MPSDWGAVNQVVDDVALAAGLGWLIVRQFVWRSTDLFRMLRLPVLILAAGAIAIVVELLGNLRWGSADWIILGELLLVAVTGTIMGRVTVYRVVDDQLQYKLSPSGVSLWALFVCVRVGSFSLASALGASLRDATGLILLSFGVNRLAAILVVARRARAVGSRQSE